MSDSNKPGPTELTELMARVFDSDASEAFGHFIVRQAALKDMAPDADDALLAGHRGIAGRRGRDGGGAPGSACLTTSARISSSGPATRPAVDSTRLHRCSSQPLTPDGSRST